MRFLIKSIKFEKHPIFGDNTVSFTNDKGEVAVSILLVGENGSGKTKLLEIINECLNSTYYINFLNKPGPEITVEIIIQDSIYRSATNKKRITKAKLMSFNRPDDNVYEHNIDLFDEDGIRVNEYIDTSISATQARGDLALKSILSGVEINYKILSPIGSITQRKLDDGNLDIYNNVNIASDIAQLFVDICAQDNADAARYMDGINNKAKGGKISINCQNFPDKRMSRFLSAYEYMFDSNLTFYNVVDNTTPIFLKDGKRLKIEDLSSGEKQVIFRGASLLKNINNIMGYPVLIDEPELSMHPKWEQKSYNYYQKIFTDSTQNQKSQIIFATHSEHVISSALDDKNSLIIDLSSMDSNNNHKYKTISNSHNIILPSTTLAEIKYQVFHIPTIDYFISLYAYVQENIARRNSISRMDKFLSENKAPFYESSYKAARYHTLPTYVRNRIDHPKNDEQFTKEQLEESIGYMIELINRYRS